jgi:hypothetical protein
MQLKTITFFAVVVVALLSLTSNSEAGVLTRRLEPGLPCDDDVQCDSGRCAKGNGVCQ